jgi:hypothetical protein
MYLDINFILFKGISFLNLLLVLAFLSLNKTTITDLKFSKSLLTKEFNFLLGKLNSSDVNKKNKTYTSEETLGDVVAVRSYKDSDKYEINYTFLNKIAK